MNGKICSMCMHFSETGDVDTAGINIELCLRYPPKKGNYTRVSKNLYACGEFKEIEKEIKKEGVTNE